MTRNIQHIYDLIYSLTLKEMRVRYKSSFLGYLWSIAHPLAFALVFFVAFKIVMRFRMPNYALFLLTGLFPWQWLSNSIAGSPKLFISNSSIIKKVIFPRNILVICSVLQDMIHFIIAIPVILILMFIYDEAPTLVWLYGLPILLAVQFVYAYGLSLIISTTNLFLRDLERLTSLCVTFIFYLTPIIYPASMIPEQYRPLLYLNPFAPLLIAWRQLFLEGTLNYEALGMCIVYAGLSVLIGQRIYNKLSWKFAEVL